MPARTTSGKLVACEDCARVKEIPKVESEDGPDLWRCGAGHFGGRAMYMYTGPDHDRLPVQSSLRRKRLCRDFLPARCGTETIPGA